MIINSIVYTEYRIRLIFIYYVDVYYLILLICKNLIYLELKNKEQILIYTKDFFIFIKYLSYK